MTPEAALATRAWEQVDAHAGDLYQTRRWAELDCTMQPGAPEVLEVHLGGQTLRLPTIRRPMGLVRLPTARHPQGHATSLLASPYGYPGIVGANGTNGANGAIDPEAFAAAAADAARERDAAAIFVRLHPILDDVFPDLDTPHAATVEHGPTAAIDLRGGLDEAWRAMRPRLRSYVRGFERTGLTLHVDRWDQDYEAFQLAYAETMERLGASPLYRFGPAYWDRLRQLATDDLCLLTIRAPDAGVVAGAIITNFDGQAGYHLGATRSDHLHLHLLEVLLWTAAQHVAPTADFLHLGGGVGTARDGLYQLKRGMGRRACRFRTLRIIADPDAYAAAIEPHPVDPKAARFPPAA